LQVQGQHGLCKPKKKNLSQKALKTIKKFPDTLGNQQEIPFQYFEFFFNISIFNG
jgi:hypothetical protein